MRYKPKLIIATVALSLSLNYTISPADNAIVSEKPVNIVIDGGNVIINNSNVTINGGNISNLNPNTKITAGCIEYVNSIRSDIPYKPSIDEIPNITNILQKAVNVNYVSKGSSYEKVPYQSKDINSRVYEILGNDIDLDKEEWDATLDKSNSEIVDNYSNKFYEESFITKEQAIQSIYKSVQKEDRYKITTKVFGENKVVKLEDTSIWNEIKLSNVEVDQSKWRIRTFVSRTDKEYYWNLAVKDGIVGSKYNSEDSTKKLNTYEFCDILKRILELKGEPVITELEKQMLLIGYGKKLPTYLPNNYIESISYLLARGIVNDKIEYNQNINRKSMLEILCKAKDKNSRETFKEIKIPYIESLVKGGFYPTETIIEESPISEVSWSVSSGTIPYLDYLIKIDSSTKFIDDKGNMSSNIVVDNGSGEQYEGSEYLGIRGDYYHIRVPVDIKNTKAIRTTLDGKLVFNLKAIGSKTKPVSVEIGGGLYENISTLRVLYRKSFTKDFEPTLIDTERKKQSQNQASIDNGIYLAPQGIKSTVTFISKDIGKLLWAGKPLKENPNYKSLGNDKHQIEINASDPYMELLSKLTVTGGYSDAPKMPAYVKNDKVVLVSLSYLKKNNLANDIAQLTDGKFMLYSNKSNICVDIKNRMIIAGQAIIEIPKDDSSPLIVQDPTSKEYLIDYRAVIGMTNGFLVVKNSAGDITLEVSGTSSDFRWNNVYPLLGEDCNLSIRSNKNEILLDDSYPLSNFLVYRSRRSSVNTDYLIVFKPLVKGINEPSSQTVKQLKDTFNIELNKGFTANIYLLEDNIVYQEKVDKAKNIKVGPSGEYIYVVPNLSSFSYTDYLKGIIPLPIVKENGSFIDLNSNIIENISLGEFPYDIMNKSAAKAIGVTRESKLDIKNKNYSILTNDIDSNYSITPAPAGVQGTYYPYSNGNWYNAMSNNNITTYGSMRVRAIKSSDKEGEFFSLNVGNYKAVKHPTNEVGDEPEKETCFKEVFRGIGSSVYVYNDASAFSIPSFDKTKEDSKKSVKFGIGSFNIFDWKNFKFSEMLNHLDDILSILIYAIKEILPRIMIFLLFAVCTLSLGVDNNLVIWFSDKIIDPFKILSLGIISREKIDKKLIWISAFCGITLLVLVHRGEIFDILSWLLRGVFGILERR